MPRASRIFCKTCCGRAGRRLAAESDKQEEKERQQQLKGLKKYSKEAKVR